MRTLASIVSETPRSLRIGVPVVALALAAAACGSASGSGGGTTAPSSNGSTRAMTISAVSSQKLGSKALVGSNGRTLYIFSKDTKNHSVCHGSCSAVWVPVTDSGSPKAGSDVTASSLGTIKLANGKDQVTYDGHPVYYFVKDTSAGQAKGEGLKQFGGWWYELSPSGKELTGSSSSSGSSSSGGGW